MEEKDAPPPAEEPVGDEGEAERKKEEIKKKRQHRKHAKKEEKEKKRDKAREKEEKRLLKEERKRLKEERRQKDLAEGKKPVKWTALLWDIREKYEDNAGYYTYMTARDIVIYMAFFSVVMVALLSVSGSGIFFSQFLRKQLLYTPFTVPNKTSSAINFLQVRTVDELWAYILDAYGQSTFCKGVTRELGKVRAYSTYHKELYVFETVLLGVPRLRQVRVKAYDCDKFETCYGHYSKENEDKEPFGKGEGTQWTYTKNIAWSYTGEVNTYGTGGYYVNLTRDCSLNWQSLELMQQGDWIDWATRALFLEFSLYSSENNMLWVTKLVAEQPPQGGFITHATIRSITLFRNAYFRYTYLLACQIVVGIFLVYYTVQEVRKMIVMRKRRYLTLDRIFDLAVIVLGWITIAFWIWQYTVPLKEAILPPIRLSEHGTYDGWVIIQKWFSVLEGLLITALWWKLLKYLMLFNVIYHLIASLGKIAGEFLGLVSILYSVFACFAVVGHMLFGAQAKEFGTIGNSVFTLAMLVTGSFEYYKIMNLEPIMGAIYFVLFLFFCVLLIASLFIAIYVSGFTTVNFEMLENPNRLTFGKMFTRFGLLIFRGLTLQKNNLTIDDIVQEKKMKKDWEFLTQQLRRLGITGETRTQLLEKHGLEKDSPISEEQMQNLYNDLDILGQMEKAQAEHLRIFQELEEVRQRVDNSEIITRDLVPRVDLLVDTILNTE